MNSDTPSEVINQHYTDPAPDRDVEELIWASKQLVREHGSANRAAEKTKASSHSLLLWNRLNELPDGILGYVYTGALSPSSADVIRRLDSKRDQQLVSMITVEESLPQRYVELLQREISDYEKEPEEAIKSVIGGTTVLKSVTLGFNEDTHLRLWAEAGRRQCTVAEVCEELIHERMGQITGIRADLNDKTREIQNVSSEVRHSVLEFAEQLESFDQSVTELREETNDE